MNPDLGDLEEMLANVQTQIEREIDDNQEVRVASLTNVHESPKMIKRTASFNRMEERIDYRRTPTKVPLLRVNSEINSGSQSLNGHFEHFQRNDSPRSLDYNEETGSQSSFRSEPSARLSTLSLQERTAKNNLGMKSRGKTATLPRGYGSTKEKNWEEYWAQ